MCFVLCRYDVAALVCKGLDAQINFHLKDYMQHLEVLRHCSQEELVAHIRRQSSAFSRGKSKYVVCPFYSLAALHLTLPRILSKM